MAIPNTTPTPNELYNGEMKKMKDTELRIVLMVTRATLGWEIDKETGRRKEEDWIAHYQLMERTGRKARAISYAVENCIKQGWIEARDKDGNLLDEPQKRAGKKIYYRLGKIFLDTLKTPAKSAEDEPTPAKSAPAKFAPAKSAGYKRNHYNKRKTITKELAAQSAAEPKIEPLIDKFKKINPSYEKLFSNTTQRKALKWLVDKYGAKKVDGLIDYAISIQGKKYAPVVTTPYTLKDKLPQIMIYYKKENQSGKVAIINTQ